MNNISYGETKDQIFEIAVTYHLPTYVHSLMVEELSALIAQEMIKVNPSYFVGSLGMNSAADVLEKKDKLILDLREAARFHDIGKYFCMIQVSDCYRALTKEEFELVKMHPINGYHAFFYGDISPNPMMKDVILFHHIYYNGQSGYPLSNHEDQEDKEDKKIVDIVTIADSLDAGTDDIGRAFTKGKTILQLIEELKAGEGSRYSPEVLSLFDNPELMDSIREALDVKRKEIYLKCYRNVKQG
jgi:HD-GYP domain-containing protein (c-di-GMP phosphodiesterase class II)